MCHILRRSVTHFMMAKLGLAHRLWFSALALR